MANSFRQDILREDVRLPTREFLFTLDQIGQMLDCSKNYLEKEIIFFQGRSVGSIKRRLRAVNIAPADALPVWRVSETDYKLWMRQVGIRFTEPVNVRLRKK